jgi:hypothetical protein
MKNEKISLQRATDERGAECCISAVVCDDGKCKKSRKYIAHLLVV